MTETFTINMADVGMYLPARPLTANSNVLNPSGLTRQKLAYAQGKTHDGKRDMYKTLGYNRNVKFADFAAVYKRQDVARRVIDAYPDSIWPRHPQVRNSENTDDSTPFEDAFVDLAQRIELFQHLNRLDKLVGLGEYAVLLIGVADGKDLNEPVDKLNSTDDIMFLMPFGQDSARITQYEQDVRNPRFGLPLMYSLRAGGYSDIENSVHMGEHNLDVHHSRVIHVAEGLLSNDVFGVPRLQPIMNRLIDLEKVVGGSAEMFWLNGRGGLHMNAESDVFVEDPEKVRFDANAYQHGQSRIVFTQGMTATPLEFEVHDPDKHFEIILNLIASATGIPKRILVGSERGELASSSDDKNWTFRVEERRQNFCEPRILRPVIDWFMERGILPTEEDYRIVWPALFTTSASEQADISLKKSQALATYVNAIGADLLMPPQQFFEEVLGIEYKEGEIKAQLMAERMTLQGSAGDPNDAITPAKGTSSGDGVDKNDVSQEKPR